MAKKTTAQHIDNLNRNINDVRLLLGMYSGQRTTKTGRPPKKLNVLSRSALVLAVSSWESFIEDLARNGFNFLLSQSAEPNQFPSGVKVLASEPLKKAEDRRTVWELAGSGWKLVLEKFRDECLLNFDNPNSEKIDSLFNNLLGLPKLSKDWKWPGSSYETSVRHLNEIIRIRGDIAHRVKTTTHLSDKKVLRNIVFLYKLATRSSNLVKVYLKNVTGVDPWGKVTYMKKYS